MELPKTVTVRAFLITDIAGSTTRWERFPHAMGPALARHDALLRQAVTDHQGYIYKSGGDGICATFPNATQAAAAALAGQRALAAADFSEVDGLSVRMAIHAGEAEARDGDFFGPALNRVARLAAIGHGGQILLSGTVAELVRGLLPPDASLADLGAHRLKDLSHPEPVFQLNVPGMPEKFPPLRSLDSDRHNLPLQATSFVGREAELAELAALTTAHRLVTLLGAGGLGKTRLALQTGADRFHRYTAGVRFLELAPLTQPAQVAEAAAALLGASIGSPDTAPEAIGNFLKTRNMLLILDNCEHLIGGAAVLADAILRKAPGVFLLATSREALGVPGEKLFRIPSLTVPDRTEGLTAPEALRFGAIRLFAERAALLTGDFTLTDDTAPAVAEICKRLDGIALAIELAASRTRMLRPAELLTRLNDRFRLLTGGSRMALPRHQTLKAMIDWSHDLLTHDERIVFRRLAVFAGDFSLAAAGGVAAIAPLAEADVFESLGALIDKSIVAPRAATGGETRYRLLETTRQYGFAKLQEAGEAAAIQRRLAETMTSFYRQGRNAWMVTPTETWRALYDQDADNVRAALFWSFGPEGDPAVGIGLTRYVLPLFEESFVKPERLRWLDLARRHITRKTPPHIEAQINLAIARVRYDEGGRSAEALRAFDLSKSLGDVDSAAQAATILAIGLINTDPDEAQDYAGIARSLLPNVKPTKLRGWVLGGLALVSMAQNDAEAATALIEEGLEIARRFGDRYLIHFCGLNRAEFEFRRGNAAAALAHAREAEASCRRYGDRVRLAALLTNISAYALALDELDFARAAGREALQMHAANGDEGWFTRTVAHIATLAARAGNPQTAARLAGFCAAHRPARQEIGAATGWTEAAPLPEPHMSELRHQAAWSEGADYAMDDILACALAA